MLIPRILSLVCLMLVAPLNLAAPAKQADERLPLQPVTLQTGGASLPATLGLDDRLWGVPALPGDRAALLRAIDQSLHYLQTDSAVMAYQQYPVAAFTRDRVRRSLERFRQLVVSARSPEELQTAVQREFDFYQSIGTDGQGTVSFTGYFEPIYEASRVPTAEFRYPIYRLPPRLNQWAQPHPTRVQLEGQDGLQGANGPLKGLEFVWLRDRLEAYLIQVQGSARLQFRDGSRMSVGVAGFTRYDYTSIGRELVKDGKIQQEELTLPAVIHYFRQHPEELNVYLPRNNRFVFFKETTGSPANGSLGVPVTPERSIATDKSLMPPGALALIQTQMPYPDPQGGFTQRLTSHYVLDQDTGGAIRGPGRVDIFMGTGLQAGDRAGLINSPGTLYYLLLKP